jgi:hypothetical protein
MRRLAGGKTATAPLWNTSEQFNHDVGCFVSESGRVPALTERVVPVSAAVSALATVLCCWPLPFAAAIGAAGLSAAIAPFRFWLIGLSVVLLGVGFVQMYRQPRACRTRSTASVVVLWTSAILVVVVLFLPQLLATLLANWLD